MNPQDEYHRQLHDQIHSCSRLADWIYHDYRLDCDGMAAERTTERIRGISEQHSPQAVFGVMACWVIKAVFRIKKVMDATDRPMPPLASVITNANKDASELSLEERGMMSGTQFFVLVGNDELETAEAIFNAAHASSDEDMWMLVQVVLETTIRVSSQAIAELDALEHS